MRVDPVLTSVSLVDLLHEVPRLWHFLDGQCRKALLSTSHEQRDQAEEHVHCIRSGHDLDLCHLTCGKWNRLQVLDMSNSLEFVWIAPDHQTMLQLMKGQWPQLRDLSISGVDEYGMKYLRNCPWWSLERLQLSNCEIPDDDTDCLAQAYLPNLQDLSLVSLGTYLDTVSSTYALPANSGWPLLTKLELYDACTTPGHFEVLAAGNWSHLHTLIHNDVIFDDRDFPGQCIDILASGKWPHLQTLVFKRVCFDDDNIPLLMKANWPALRSLYLAGYIQSSTILDSCMQKWPALQSLTIETKPCLVALISEQASRQWPSLHVYSAS